jgi:hypothetical protein
VRAESGGREGRGGGRGEEREREREREIENFHKHFLLVCVSCPGGFIVIFLYMLTM